MDQLKVVSINGQLVTDSREVAEMVSKSHSHLLRDIKGYSDILTQSNFGSSEFFVESTYQDSTGRTLPCYLLTRKGCDMVANKMTGEKGVLFTAAYVTKFEEMEKQLTQPRFNLPQSFSEALRLLADSEEEKQVLSTKIESDKPKVLFAESYQVSEDSILVGEMAKMLKQNGIEIGATRLFARLRSEGYLIKYGEQYNMPTQRSMELGIMEIKNGTRQSSNGTVKITRTPKITGKGQVYFINRYKKELSEKGA